MKNGKILIIDDNEDVLFALNLLLEPYVEQIKSTKNIGLVMFLMANAESCGNISEDRKSVV